MSEENPLMRMYEAQAIAVEKQMEIDRLKREREEMADGMRRLALQIGRTEESQESSNDDVMAAISRLTGQVQAIQEKMQEVDDRLNSLEERVEEKSTSVWEAIDELRQQNSLSENLLQQTGSYINKFQQHTGQMTILILGGYDGKNLFGDILLLKENNWAKLPLKLPKPTAAHGTVYLNEEMHIFGGVLGNETYKLGKNLKWDRLADMNEERHYITNSCLEWNGCIWVFGGSSDRKGEKSLKSVERYHPKEDKWIEMSSMHHARRGAAAAVWNGKFIICGGECDGKNLKSVECFYPKSGVWTVLDDLPSPLYGHVVIPCKNNLILIGGHNGKTQINSVLELSNSEGKQMWKKLPSMKNARFSFSAVVLNDEIYVIGGYDGNERLLETEIFNGTKWRDGPDLPRGRYMSVIVIPQIFADSLFKYKQ